MPDRCLGETKQKYFIELHCISRSNQGLKEIFECLCKSGSSKKLRIFLDKVMNARMKANQDALSKLDIASRQIMDIQELTPQDEELLMIHTILLENPLKPTAPFQKLLLHFPDCVTHFLVLPI